MTEVTIGAEAVAGLIAATARVSGFLVASPHLNRRLPNSGRLAVVVGLGLFLAAPLPPETLEVTGIVNAVVANLAAGLILGLLTSILFAAFATAGAMVDLSSGLSVSAVFDPGVGPQSTIFQRMFDQIALVLFFVLGGHRLLIVGLAGSVSVIGLDGDLQLRGGLADVGVEVLARYTIAALEISVPIMVALLVSEIVLGVASRLVPQANVFLLGLPLKIIVAIAVVGATLTSFPQVMVGVLEATEDLFEQVVSGLS